MRKRIKRWASAPIVVPRWGLTAFYLMVALIGVAVWLASSPSLKAVTGETIQAEWGILLGVTSLVCAVGSLREVWEPMERWALLVLFALLVGFAVAPIQLVLAGNWTRTTYSIIALTLALLAGGRFAMVLANTGRKHGRV